MRLWSILLAFAVIILPGSVSCGKEKATMNEMVMNASRALREAGGYNIIATSLEISADEILPPTSCTFFALSDDALNNLTLPSWLMMDLLHYHTSTHKLLWKTLSAMQLGSCIPTLLHGKNLVVTSNENGSVAINGVPVARPDLYTRGTFAIHGVAQPFFNPNASETSLETLIVTPCSKALLTHTPNHNLRAPPPTSPPQPQHFHRPPMPTDNLVPQSPPAPPAEDDDSDSDSHDFGVKVSWFKIQELLRSNGYISFSVAMQLEEMDLILAKDQNNVSHVTVFAPTDQNFAYVASSSSLLAAMIRFHVVPTRLRFSDLLRLPVGSGLPTLLPGRRLYITGAYDAEHPLTINNVPIVHPDVYSTHEVVVHGIFRPFNLFNITANSTTTEH